MGLVGIVGRVLLGLFFLLPGIMKAMDPSVGLDLMVARDVPFHVPLFWASVVIEIVFGAMLVFGFQAVLAALVLAALTMAINIGVHNFWAVPEDLVRAELQLFIKNTAVLGGLLVAAAWAYSKR
jgi:putative oxidoreductase